VVRRKTLQKLAPGRLTFVIGFALLAGLLFIQNGSARAISDFPEWNVVASANPAPITNILDGLAVLAPDNAWAVGSALDRQHGNQTLIEHWDGTEWNAVDSPTPNILATHAAHLTSVAAAGTNDVWAVGEYVNSTSGNTHTLIEHWNGRRWSIVPGPNPGALSNSLTSITALNGDNIWAAGNYRDTKDGGSKAMIVHWDGQEWNLAATFAPANFRNSLNGIAAVSSHNIWAVGNMIDKSQSGAQSQVLIEHWNGSDWSRVSGALLPEGAGGVSLQSVSAVHNSNRLLWAVGSYYRGGQSHLSTLTEVWNGREWRMVDSPSRSNFDNTLVSVAARSPYDIWAVGGMSQNGSSGQSLIEHWDGMQWTVVAHPDPGPRSAIHFLSSIMYYPGSRHVWCVGLYGDSTRINTMAELYL
jgi:hypothetical protein